MVGCVHSNAGDVIHVGASQNSARPNRTYIDNDRYRRRIFAGEEYWTYDDFIHNKLKNGDDKPIANLPAEHQKTRNQLNGYIWSVWRGNPDLNREDMSHWEPMCKACVTCPLTF